MTWTAPEITRDDVPPIADERTSLEAWLTFHRQTLLRKCAGLTAEELKTASVPPSNLTLLGLVRHMADVERAWFQRRFLGRDIPGIFWSDEHPDGDFDLVADADAEADLATFQAEVAEANAVANGRSLDDTFYHDRRGADMDLRWIYVHMIEEYARHNGHADFLRERIDGVTGE